MQSNSKTRSKAMLRIIAVIYACWFFWLLYIAWVNVQAGNQ
ncbi:MAG: hypothetical protein AAGG44_08830 [Planctomycetota bacterium]